MKLGADHQEGNVGTEMKELRRLLQEEKEATQGKEQEVGNLLEGRTTDSGIMGNNLNKNITWKLTKIKDFEGYSPQLITLGTKLVWNPTFYFEDC